MYLIPGGASGKEPSCPCRRYKRLGFYSWFGKIPWSRKWQPTPVFLLGRSHGQRIPACHSTWDCKKLDMTEKLSTNKTYIVCMHLFSEIGVTNQLWGFSGSSAGKESACNAGDPGSIPALGRSPRVGNGNPLQYSCLENPVD